MNAPHQPPTPEQAGPSGVALLNDVRLFLEALPRDLGRGSLNGMLVQLEFKIRAALASPGAMEGAQAAQPAFALQSCWLYAARHRKEEWAKTILGFCGAAGCGSPLRAAHPPTGEPT